MNRSWIALITLTLLLPVSIAHADGAALYVTPETGTYSIGDTFEVQVLADSAGAAINAAEADITFDPSALQVLSVSSDGSILDTWPSEPKYDNSEGTITFSGVANQRYTGSAGLLVTITFKAVKNAQDGAHFASGAVLAADGVESNIITAMHSGQYAIQPVEVPAQGGDSDAIGASDQEASSTAASDQDASSTSSDSSSAGDSDAELAAPVLQSKPQIAVGDRIVINGTAPPGSTVSVWLQEGSKKAQRTDLDADESGAFSFTSDTQANAGPYQAWAFTLGAAGARSDKSNVLSIVAIDPETASVALLQQTLIEHAVSLTALLVFGGIVTAYIYHRHRLEKYRLELERNA